MPRLLPDWIDSYLEYTDNSEPKESFRRWVAISTIASVLQRKVHLDLGVQTFYPNMFIVLVGPPATRKGTAMEPGRRFLERLGLEVSADEASRQYLVKILKDSHKFSTDSQGIVYAHSSLTIIASELTVFLGYANIELLAILCKWFDCESQFKYGTYQHGKQDVSNVWVNLLGATTPTQIQTAMPNDAVGSGFTSRTVFVYEDKKAKIVDIPALSPAAAELEPKLEKDLGHIKTMCGKFTYTQEFIEAYAEWRALGERNPPISDVRFAFYLDRRHVHLLKMATIYSASARDDMRVTLRDFERASATLEAAEKNMYKVFRGVGTNPLAAVQVRIMQMIAEQKQLPIGDIMRAFHEDVNSEQLGLVIATLEKMGFCQLEITKGIVYYRRGIEE